jgi:hypothetical protein
VSVISLLLELRGFARPGKSCDWYAGPTRSPVS